MGSKVMKNAVFFGLLVVMMLERALGIESQIDALIYSAYMDNSIAGGVLRALFIVGLGVLIYEIIAGVKHGANKQKSID